MMTRPKSLVLAALGLTLLARSFAADPVMLDRVVAVVNKSAITEQELQVRMATFSRNLAKQNVPPPPPDAMRKQVLELMVTERVLTDYAADTGLRVDDTQIDRTLERIAEQQKMTLPQFKAQLEQEGTRFAQFREEVRQDMTIQRLREREVDNRVYVTDAEIDQYLQANKNAGQNEQEFQLAHILINLPEGASPDVLAGKQKRAELAARELAAGKPFAQVAATYSEANDALSGGDLGWRSAGRLPPMFLDAVSRLAPGGTTRIMRSPAGFHILKLVDKRVRDGKEIVSQTHARHILIKVNEGTSDSDAKARITEIRDRLVNGGKKFEEEAKLHSEDGSASKGGDLDWLSPGDTVPEFDTAMNALKPGELSQPIRSPFGWHLIEVVGRRDQDVTRDHERLRVRNELRDRKADQQYEEWVQQQRDRAFVDVRLDDK
ncbi:peptidylprolyl isomerase [Chitinimonas sp.]|uniref:peptidylprolyl isomerase n=1 Tax=Chitinimonas sp. TaxID=1934313 RepID=UPI0035B42871